MASLSFTDSFKRFNAKLANPQWAYSAEADDGSIVFSCWAHKLVAKNGVMTYDDHLSRWAPNIPGKNLLSKHLRLGLEEKRTIRLVIATTPDPGAIDRGEVASKIKKSFEVRRDVVGEVVLFDGDRFVLEYRRA